MRKMTFAAAALMCSAGAFAQTGPAQPDAPTASPTTTQPSDATTMSPAAAPDAPPMSTAPGSTAPSSTDAASAGATMAGSGSVDIAAYDGNKDGALSPLEFGMAMKGSDPSLSAEAKRERFSRASGNGAIKLLNETAADFSKADKNQDRRVDPTELAMLHSGGVSAATGAATPITSGAGSMGSAPPETGATMNTSPSGSPDTGMTADSPGATDADETDPSNPNTTATVPPTEPKR